MYDISDHPEIACTMCTGFPSPLPNHIECASCGALLSGNDEVYKYNDPHGRRSKDVDLCEDCIEERIATIATSIKASRLGIEHSTVIDRFEI